MWEKIVAAWPYGALAILAVLSGQIARLGHRAEKGLPLTRARLFIELSMLPALGSIVGAVAADHDLPIWQILSLGVAAGWGGFATIRFVHAIVVDLLRYMVEKRAGPR
jgi:hypothetical protein